MCRGGDWLPDCLHAWTLQHLTSAGDAEDWDAAALAGDQQQHLGVDVVYGVNHKKGRRCRAAPLQPLLCT